MFRKVVTLTDKDKGCQFRVIFNICLFVCFGTLLRGPNFGQELNTKISETACAISIWNMHLWRASHLIFTQLNSFTYTNFTVQKAPHALISNCVLIVIIGLSRQICPVLLTGRNRRQIWMDWRELNWRWNLLGSWSTAHKNKGIKVSVLRGVGLNDMLRGSWKCWNAKPFEWEEIITLSNVCMGNQKSNISVLEDEKDYVCFLGGFTFYSKNCCPCAETEQAVLQCSGQF